MLINHTFIRDSEKFFLQKAIEELREKYIKNPSDLVSVGDIVKVKVIKIDTEKQKVSLSMKI